MSSLSVQANHYNTDVGIMGDDWNTISIGGQERSLRTAEDVALLVSDIRNGQIDGLGRAKVEVDGHRITVDGQTYDLEKASETARFAADLRDGRLDGATVGAEDLYVEDRWGAGAIVLSGQRFDLRSEKDAHKLLAGLRDHEAPGYSASEDARWIGGKRLTAGGKTYDLSSSDARHELALDLADGVLDGATAVDPDVTAVGGAAPTASGATACANGYPTLSPDDEHYAEAWTDWMKTHTFEDFKRARDRGAIPDERKLFGDVAFGSLVREKGEESSRYFEMLSFMQRNKQQIFEHISRGFV